MANFYNRLKLLIFLAGSFIFNITIHAQHYSIDKVAKTEIARLWFLTGEWKGEGWTLENETEKSHFQHTNKVSFILDTTALLIESISKKGNLTIDHSVSILRYKSDKYFTLSTFYSNNQANTLKAVVDDNVTRFYFNDSTRNVFQLNENLDWYEIRESKKADEWQQNAEMILKRISPLPKK